MSEIILIASFIFGVIGVVAAFIYLRDRFFPYSKVGWKFIEKKVREISNKLVAQDFMPTLIIGLGRGGAALGSLISSRLGRKPLFVVDTAYVWEDRSRKQNVIFPVSIPSSFLKKVLIVSGEVHTGATMGACYKYFQEIGAISIKTATLCFEKGAIIDVDFKGFTSSKKNILLPWTEYTLQGERPDRRSDTQG